MKVIAETIDRQICEMMFAGNPRSTHEPRRRMPNTPLAIAYPSSDPRARSPCGGGVAYPAEKKVSPGTKKGTRSGGGDSPQVPHSGAFFNTQLPVTMTER